MPSHVLTRSLVALGVALYAALALWPVLARADAPPDCPAAPSAYSGDDPVVGELRAERTDAAATCAALVARLDVVHGDAAPSTVHAVVDNWPDTSDAPAGHVHVDNLPDTQTVAYSATTAAVVDGQAESLHGDVWVLIGAIVGCFAASEILRKVWP